MLEAPEIVKVFDKEYKVEGFTQEIQEAYQRMMEASFLELIHDNKQVLGNDYLQCLKLHFWEVKHGAYKWGSDNFYLFVNIPANFIELLSWCFSKHQPPPEDLAKWVTEEPELASELFTRLNNATKKN